MSVQVASNSIVSVPLIFAYANNGGTSTPIVNSILVPVGALSSTSATLVRVSIGISSLSSEFSSGQSAIFSVTYTDPWGAQHTIATQSVALGEASSAVGIFSYSGTNPIYYSIQPTEGETFLSQCAYSYVVETL